MKKTRKSQNRPREVGFISYLVDQQCSQQLYVDVVDQAVYQPIVLSKATGGGPENEFWQLGKHQALALADLLKKAAKRCPEPPENVEHPGYLLD